MFSRIYYLLDPVMAIQDAKVAIHAYLRMAKLRLSRNSRRLQARKRREHSRVS